MKELIEFVRLSPRRWLKSLPGEELFFLSMLVLGWLIFIAASVSQAWDVAGTATAVEGELADLPFAPGPPPGTRTILTGTVSAATAPLFKGFIVYVEERYRAGAKNYPPSGWEVSGGQRQAFAVDTAAGSMKLASAEFSLPPRVSDTGQPLLTEWDSGSAARIEEPPGVIAGARRYRGLVAGGPVTAVGTVKPDGTFDADYVVGLDLEEFRARLATIASGEPSQLPYLLTGVGCAGLLLTIALFVRSWRRKTD